jgi:hypothetical protein
MTMTCEKITYQLIAEENGGEDIYKPNDNRTHIGLPLGRTPAIDMQCHMGLRKDGNGGNSISTVRGVSFHGVSNIELMKDAGNRVFHFPKASNISGQIIKIKTAKLRTLYPASMVSKFSLKESQLEYSQQTPIFYDNGVDLFFIVMDERFLKDLTANEILSDTRKTKDIKVYESKSRKTSYLAITGKTMPELLENLKGNGSAFDTIKTNYRRRFIDLKNSKRVIVLRYETDNEESMKDINSHQISIPSHSNRANVIALMMRQKMEMEIFQAAQVEDLFYLMNENGDIDSKAIVSFNENETDYDFRKRNLENEGSIKITNGGLTYLVVNYTIEDWEFIKQLQIKMHTLCRELESFFLSTKTEIGLEDKSFSKAKMEGSGLKLLN